MKRTTKLLKSIQRGGQLQARRASSNVSVFSGIQPTGIPHLGNYLGALRQWVGIQDKSPESARLIFCIVDLHAITQPQEADQLRERKMEMLAALLAVGLDPRRCTIFEQSRVPAHSELMWILSCVASMGRLNRMTQWKVRGFLGFCSPSPTHPLPGKLLWIMVLLSLVGGGWGSRASLGSPQIKMSFRRSLLRPA